MEVTIGGDRLGAGHKMTQEMHEYNRSSFNQEQDFKSSLAPGILYPFLCIPMTNGDSMDIDLDTFVRTLPTKGPLFGSFKLQCDIFSVPMRLYNGVLHNNPTKIGMNMSQIYMPKLQLEYYKNAPIVKGLTKYDWQVHPTSLLKYLGFSGIGQFTSQVNSAARKINAIPVLGYYDIFKNYYANKQEENAYVITPGNIRSIIFDSIYADQAGTNQLNTETNYTWSDLGYDPETTPVTYPEIWVKVEKVYEEEDPYTFYDDYVQFSFDNGTTWLTGGEAMRQGLAQPVPQIGEAVGIAWIFTDKCMEQYDTVQITEGQPIAEGDIKLETFPLDNIDRMRESILNNTEIGTEYEITTDYDNYTGDYGYPYYTLHARTENEISYNSFAENGLVVKTYQSDIFNNWIDTEWIEGENGVAALSAVAINNDTLEIDALILGQKVYNMLNRIALAGGTYEDWQDAVYTQGAVRKAETPMYEGGMSAEIMFEEVISNAETMVDGDFQALGSLGGKGTQVGKKGGNNIHVKAKEPIFVMGIVSITPRICYTQGNEWYLTELNTFDDLHKPALDGIGFQDLITEQMAWFGNYYIPGPNHTTKLMRTSAGKTVAWANYMTAVDKAYGDFARPEGKGFMVLARNYEIETNESQVPYTYGIKDLTTYIDPAKFNYAFAYTDLAAQNFWVQIHSKIVTRRVMSAHQIPNL